jgi:WD40 repeat protein
MPSNPEKLKILKDISRPYVSFSVSLVPNTTKIYLGCSDFCVYEADYSAAKFEPKELYKHESYVTGVALVDKTLVSGGYEGKLIWWDLAANKQIRSIESHSKWIRNVIASPDGKYVVSIADDMFCRVWETATGKKVFELKGHEEKTPNHFASMLYAVAFSKDGKVLATGDKVGHIVLWNMSDGKQIKTLESPGMYTWDPVQRRHSIGGIRSLAFSPDGKNLAVGGVGKIGNIDHLDGKSRVEIFDLSNGKSIHVFENDKFKGLVNWLSYAPDGSWLLGAGGAGEGFFQFLDVANKKITKQDKVSMHIHDVAMNDTAETLIAAGHNRIIAYEMKG